MMKDAKHLKLMSKHKAAGFWEGISTLMGGIKAVRRSDKYNGEKKKMTF